MVEDLKKQMRRFENLINFEGKLDVTSRESMVELINALDLKFKEDVQNSLRLHRLEFYHDLVEKHVRNREKREEDDISKLRAKSRKTVVKKEAIDKNPVSEQQPRLKPKISDEIMTIKATDIDDWKDLMTLSRIYYVMRHPRSVGLNWKRRISKKKTIEKFEDKDFIEWRVSQDFRLRGLEEWAQRRSDARRLAERIGFADIVESDEDSEIEELFEMFDPAYRKKCKDTEPKKKKPLPDRPFKLTDECIEDWTESYSDDSTTSDIEDITEQEMEDLMTDFDEMGIETPDEEKTVSFAEAEKEEDISELLAVYPEFSIYKEPIFREMDEAKTFEDWLKLYKKAISQEVLTTKESEVKYEKKFDTITEDEEEAYDEDLSAKKEEGEVKLVEKQKHETDVEVTEERTIQEEEGSRDKELLAEEEEEGGESYFEKLKRVLKPDVEDTEERTIQEEERSRDEELLVEEEEGGESYFEKLKRVLKPDVEDTEERTIQEEEGSRDKELLAEEEEEGGESYFEKLKRVLKPDVEDTEERTIQEEEGSRDEDLLAEEEEKGGESYFEKFKRVLKPDVEDTEERTVQEEEGSRDDEELFADKEKSGEKLEKQRSKPDIKDTEVRSTEEEGPYDEDRLKKEEIGEKLVEKKTAEPDVEDTKLKVTKEEEDRSEENLSQEKEEAEENLA